MTEPTILHPQALAPQSATAKLLHMIERVARDPGVDMTVLERLMAMRERVVADERRMSFNEAVGKAKAKMPEIKKNNTVNLGNNRSYAYEDLAQIERTIKDTLGEFGLSYRFRTDSVSKPGIVVVTCILSHRDGHSEENSLSASLSAAIDTGAKMNSTQALGSCLTYLSRYALKAALGLAASVDDDGAAGGKVEVVSDEQALRIANLIAETKSNIGLFLKYVGVPSISDIPAAQYLQLLSMLERKRGPKPTAPSETTP